MRIVDVLPITAAGVTLISPGAVPGTSRPPTSPRCGSSGCRPSSARGRASRRTRRARPSPSPTSRRRPVPDLRAARAEAGLVAVFTFPLRHGDDRLGALDLYRDTPARGRRRRWRGADAGRRRRRLPAERPGPRGDLKESSDRATRQRAARPADRAAEPGAADPAPRARDPAVPPVAARRRRSCSSTWTGSSRSTTPTATTVGRRAARRRRAPAHRPASRPGDTLARLAGDEFVFLCEDLDQRGRGRAVAARIGDALAEPFALAGVTVRVDGERRHRVRRPRRRASPSSCSRTRTPRCTRPSAGAGPAPDHRPAGADRDRPSATTSSATCAARSTAAAATSTTSRSCAPPTGGSSASRRCCAGRTRIAGRPAGDGRPAGRAERADHRDRAVDARAGLPGPRALGGRDPATHRSTSPSTCRPTS